MRLILFLLFATLPLGATAQEDPMETQRCIWRCLAASPGASSPEYNQCVDRLCVGNSEPQPPVNMAIPAPVQSRWRAGIASDGVHRFAGTDAEQGYGFYYFCTPATSFFSLLALPMGPGQFRFVIGDVGYLVPFDRSRGDLSVEIPPASAFMQGVQAGHWLRVEALDGTPLIQFSLAGARDNLQQAITGCFG